MPHASSGLLVFFVAQVFGLALFWTWLAGGRTGVRLLAWLALTGGAAAEGWFRFGTFPPRIAVVLAAGLILTFALAFTGWGRTTLQMAGLPLLIGFQSFRILVEIFLWWGHREGLVPVQMTWEGRNFDVLTGLAALPVAWLAARGVASRLLITLWNAIGAALLLNIVTVAILSMPTPFRVFSPPNLFVAEAPFIWLPALLVTSALMGHLLVWRSLRDTKV